MYECCLQSLKNRYIDHLLFMDRNCLFIYRRTGAVLGRILQNIAPRIGGQRASNCLLVRVLLLVGNKALPLFRTTASSARKLIISVHAMTTNVNISNISVFYS